MTNSIKVSPQIIDDIEFYVSNDGKHCGVSISGLARLCGVSRQTMSQRILEPLCNYDAAKTLNKSLEPLINNVFIPQLESNNGANVVSSYATALIIGYYAYESKIHNEIAKKSLLKFAARGIDNWIKEITHYSENEKQDRLLLMMEDLIGEVKSMSVKVNRLENLQRTTITYYPGLAYINDNLAKESKQPLLESDDIFTVKEWLESKDIELSKSEFHSLSCMVAAGYKLTTGKDPKNKYEPVRRKDGSLYQRKIGRGYKQMDFNIIEAAYQKLLNRRSI